MLRSASDELGGSDAHRLEAWGGAECTVNRVGDRYCDQLAESGHAAREGDFELLAGLGLEALRFPILWERVAPRPDTAPDWEWCDAGLAALRRHGIRPIAGLIHHGSGPRHTSLVDDGFAPGLARHAARAAARYPWIRDWAPVNEPLTTARFSALYGLWYPHARDERLFWTALLNQIDATRLAMRAIRAVQPAARLIQTEDLGRTYATASLADQAAFDNQRRWMTWDLLCGRVGRAHPLWGRLVDFGLEQRLQTIHDDPCPPDVIGIDHYLTSDRLLDERLSRYPPDLRGGNGRTAYCDVEAVRVLAPAPPGLRGAIDEAWTRYGLPIALTEIHNGCTRDEQARWLDEAWTTARDALARGIDVRAVTAWALFGSKGWDTLLTAPGTYEPGVFDVSAGMPRPTALAAKLRGQADGSHRTGGAGWWRRDLRLRSSPTRRPAPMAQHVALRPDAGRRPILIVGATGTLGQALAAECRHRDLAHVLTHRAELDLLDPESIAAALEAHRPWAVVNAAGWVRVDDAEDDPLGCQAVNADGAVALARACTERAVPSLSFSTDLVFDGRARTPYCEDEAPAPLNTYGRSKLDMERGVAALAGAALIIRTAAFFSPHDPHNFAMRCVTALRRGQPFPSAADCTVSPTYVPDLCRNALDLLIDGETGTWHLTNHEPLTWFEFARRIASAAGLNKDRVISASAAALGWKAARPRYAALGSRRGLLMPSLESATARFATELSRQGASAGRIPQAQEAFA